VRDLPGPGQHQLPSTLEARKGTISRHFVPSSLDDAVRRARGLPGPGAHDLKHPPPTGGRISDAKVKTTHDLAVQRAKLTPAPGTYDRAGASPSGGNWRDMAPRRRERPGTVAAVGPGQYDTRPANFARTFGAACGVRYFVRRGIKK